MNKLYVVGIGPGGYEDMTIRAARILEECDVIIGYTVYVDLVREHFAGKTFLTTPMTQEIRRCEMAFEEAVQGKYTAMVCSGDAGVYGMAGLILGMQERYPEVCVEVVPGVTAALAGAAVLGAPLIHDFAVISLSDLMTPWSRIEERLRHAAQADFGICLYNPSSKKRYDYLRKACDIILQERAPETVCGYVCRIGRENQKEVICTLEELKEAKVDMFTTVFIGNSRTKVKNGRMVTPRGYANE